MHAPTGSLLLRSMVLIGLTLGVVGCSDESPEPGRVGTPTPTTQSASPSPTETPVEQQVEAAVRAYYAELTRAAQTNDTSKLKQLLDKNCPCYRAVRVIDSGARRGETTPDASWDLRFVLVHDVTGGAAVAEVRYRVSGYDVLNRSGKVIDHISRRSSHLDLSMLTSNGSWIVANIFDLEGS